MKMTVKQLTNLLDQPTFNANTVKALFARQVVNTWDSKTNAETEQPQTADGFTFVHTPGGDTGWIEAFLLDGYVRPEVDETAFVLSCLSAEYDTNAADDTDPFYVAAEFILARAILETKISNTA